MIDPIEDITKALTELALAYRLPDGHSIPHRYVRLYQKSLHAYLVEFDLHRAMELMEEFLEHCEDRYETLPEPCLKFIYHLDHNAQQAQEFEEKVAQRTDEILAERQATQSNLPEKPLSDDPQQTNP